MPNTLSHLVQREHELDRARTRGLARQQWAAVIEVEARIAECKRLREWLAKEEQHTFVKTEYPLSGTETGRASS